MVKQLWSRRRKHRRIYNQGLEANSLQGKSYIYYIFIFMINIKLYSYSLQNKI